MSLNDERCPYCFNKFADLKFTGDPILTKDGAKVVYDEATGLLIPEPDLEKRRYKGLSIIRNKHITELQEINDDNKPAGGWTPVEGEVGSFWIPNKIHIKELRDAIEKGLGITESTTPAERTIIMEQYLNYDEDGVERQNPHQLDWNDPTLTSEIWMGNISHMHIEDLRKYTTQDVTLMNATAGWGIFGYLTNMVSNVQVTLGNKTDSDSLPPYSDPIWLKRNALASVSSKGRFLGNCSGTASAKDYIYIWRPNPTYYTLVYLRYFQTYTPSIKITPTLTLFYNISFSGSTIQKYITFINNTNTYFFILPASGTNIYSFFTSVMGRIPTEEDKVYSVHCLGNSQAIVPKITYPTYVEEDFPFYYPISCSASLNVSQLSFII